MGTAKWLLLGGEGGMQGAPSGSARTPWAAVGARELILCRDGGTLTAPLTGQELARGKPTGFVRVTSKVLIR